MEFPLTHRSTSVLFGRVPEMKRTYSLSNYQKKSSYICNRIFFSVVGKIKINVKDADYET
jgi:hypothetical protein